MDQIVFSLWELRNGHPPPPKRRTQFPICEKPEDFRARIKPDVEGLWFEDVAVIEKLQPYNGADWIARLKALAEGHKHKTQIVIQGRMVESDWTRQFTLADTQAHPDAFVAVPAVPYPVPKTMQVDARFTEPVTLGDGSIVIDTLEILQAQVASVIDQFQAPFN